MRYKLSEFLARSFEESPLLAALEALPPLSAAGPWLAGGAIRRAVTGKPLDSDFDLFFSGPDQLQEALSWLKKRGAVVTSTREQVITLAHDDRRIQLISFGFYQTPDECIDAFDFTICQFATDGESLIVGDFTLWDCGRKKLALHRLTYGSSTLRRLIKYTKEGYEACGGVLADILERTVEDPATIHREVQYVD